MQALKQREKSNRQFQKRKERDAKFTLEFHHKARVHRRTLFKRKFPGAWRHFLLLCQIVKTQEAGRWLILAEQVIRLKNGLAPFPMDQIIKGHKEMPSKYLEEVLTAVAFGHDSLAPLAIAVGVMRDDKKRARQSLKLTFQ